MARTLYQVQTAWGEGSIARLAVVPTGGDRSRPASSRERRYPYLWRVRRGRRWLQPVRTTSCDATSASIYCWQKMNWPRARDWTRLMISAAVASRGRLEEVCSLDRGLRRPTKMRPSAKVSQVKASPSSRDVTTSDGCPVGWGTGSPSRACSLPRDKSADWKKKT